MKYDEHKVHDYCATFVHNQRMILQQSRANKFAFSGLATKSGRPVSAGWYVSFPQRSWYSCGILFELRAGPVVSAMCLARVRGLVSALSFARANAVVSVVTLARAQSVVSADTLARAAKIVSAFYVARALILVST